MLKISELQFQKIEQQERKFRPEIQGLRALAVLLVASYHFWFGKVSGGVDVFLLISAFLMAGSFTRKIEKGSFSGLKTVFTYWVHVFKRILPLATLTVLAVLLGIYFFLPQDRWLSLIDEAKAVMTYRENWWSIHNLVDYYAADSGAASPFRHFWSLSVQGQIYIIWPLLFLLGWLLIKVFKLPARPTLALIFGAVFAASLSYSVYITARNQQVAYFNTWARLWEFALGTLVALILPLITLHPILRAVLGWLGLAMIVSCGFLLDVEGAFPGYFALWPTLAASMIILAGDTQTKYGPEKLLTLRPLLKLGGFSYALYLIHWPLLVFYLARVKEEKTGLGAGLVLLGISIFFAWAATKFIETPLRRWKWSEKTPLHTLGFATAFMLFGLSPAYSWDTSLERKAEYAQTHRAQNNVGAKELENGFQYEGEENPILLPLRTMGADWSELGPECATVDSSLPLSKEELGICNYTYQAQEASQTVVAVGNSHMQMWSPALKKLAEQENWNLILLTKGGCFYGYEDNEDDDNLADCQEAAENMQSALEAINPDILVLTGTRSAAATQDSLLTGIESRVASMTEKGMTVIGIRDTPRLSVLHSACLDDGASEEDCAMSPGQDVYADPQLQMEVSYPGFGAVNMSDVVCPENSCPVQIGNVYVYMDYDHITNTYAETTTDFFSSRFLDALHRAQVHSGKGQGSLPE